MADAEALDPAAARAGEAALEEVGSVGDESRWSKRCPICGWFVNRRGWCANEVPVQGGWLREHL